MDGIVPAYGHEDWLFLGDGCRESGIELGLSCDESEAGPFGERAWQRVAPAWLCYIPVATKQLDEQVHA